MEFVWDANATFYRVGPFGPGALADGAIVAPGDQLFMRFYSSKKAFVYVLNDDGSPQPTVEFPLEGENVELQNPLKANTLYELPGGSNATKMNWRVDGRGNREVFLVIVADAPVKQIEASIQTWRHAHANPSGNLRGAPDLVPMPSESNSLSTTLQSLLKQIGETKDRGARVRQWRFVFPYVSRDAQASPHDGSQ
jgi:hypothetical protein